MRTPQCRNAYIGAPQSNGSASDAEDPLRSAVKIHSHGSEWVTRTPRKGRCVCGLPLLP